MQNRDVMVMTVASFFASIASFIVQMGFWFGGMFDDNNEGGGISAIAVIAISALVYMISFVLLQALSRYREFAADRGSAIITGRPSALISALLEDLPEHEADPDPRSPRRERRDSRVLHLPAGARQTVATLFSTHPPLEARIKHLQRLEAQLQGTA